MTTLKEIPSTGTLTTQKGHWVEAQVNGTAPDELHVYANVGADMAINFAMDFPTAKKFAAELLKLAGGLDVEKLREAAELCLDDDPCRQDHHGNCQAHGLENPCEQALLRAALGKEAGCPTT